MRVGLGGRCVQSSQLFCSDRAVRYNADTGAAVGFPGRLRSRRHHPSRPARLEPARPVPVFNSPAMLRAITPSDGAAAPWSRGWWRWRGEPGACFFTHSLPVLFGLSDLFQFCIETDHFYMHMGLKLSVNLTLG